MEVIFSKALKQEYNYDLTYWFGLGDSKSLAWFIAGGEWFLM